MKHMIEWSFSTSTYKEGMRQFLETGGPAPEGVTTLGRWHAPGSKTGFHLVEGNPADVTKLNVSVGIIGRFKYNPRGR